MNFRNISSWCIRNPVFPIVLFVGLMLAGLIVVRPDAGEQRAGHRFPGGDRVRVASPAPRRTRWKRRSPSASNPRSAASTASRRSTARSVEGNSTTFVQFQLGTPTDRAVNDVRNAIVADPQQPARGHPRAAGHPRRRRRRADLLRRRADHRHDARAVELVHRQYGRQAPARPSGHRRGHARRRRRPDHPRHPRSRGAPGAGHHRRAGQPAASPEQHERRRRPRRDRRLRAVGARARQCARTPISCRRRRSRCRAAASSSSPTSARSRTAIREQRSIAKMNGRQVVTFMIQRAKGSSEVTAYDAAWKELQQAREGESQGPLLRGLQHRRLHQGAIQIGDGRPDRRRHPRRSRRPALPSRHPRDRDLRARDPDVRDPRLLVHEHDGDHAQLHVDDGHGPGRGRAGR